MPLTATTLISPLNVCTSMRPDTPFPAPSGLLTVPLREASASAGTSPGGRNNVIDPLCVTRSSSAPRATVPRTVMPPLIVSSRASANPVPVSSMTPLTVSAVSVPRIPASASRPPPLLARTSPPIRARVTEPSMVSTDTTPSASVAEIVPVTVITSSSPAVPVAVTSPSVILIQTCAFRGTVTTRSPRASRVLRGSKLSMPSFAPCPAPPAKKRSLSPTLPVTRTESRSHVPTRSVPEGTQMRSDTSLATAKA
jgi:hypothetical protein